MKQQVQWWVESVGTGLRFARGFTPSVDDAVREATRYARQYAEECAVRWVVRQGRKNLIQGCMASRAT